MIESIEELQTIENLVWCRVGSCANVNNFDNEYWTALI